MQDPTPDLLIRAYSRGIFPMVDRRSGEVVWLSPDPRGILPLDGLRVSKSLARAVRSGRFEIRSNGAFGEVIRECAAARPGRWETWIDERLVDAYTRLHEMGLAHSVEAWRDGELVGGLYGVQVGAAFCGESMFSRPERGGTDASKVCLVKLVEWLRGGGFQLLDTQFTSPHLERLGVIEVPRDAYLERLGEALRRWGDWPGCSAWAPPGRS
ncbi:MAG: leucyl/phenylalanyl-tRNA--protein transferase [Proteobacteria bacterium]|nr:leucyl/phenylalanyl-tRNA--protein transferase [Pseudomonadota bacterium]